MNGTARAFGGSSRLKRMLFDMLYYMCGWKSTANLKQGKTNTMITNIIIVLVVISFIGFSNILILRKASNLVCRKYAEDIYNKADKEYNKNK